MEAIFHALLVEDDPSIRVIAEIALQIDPFIKVHSVTCGQEALLMASHGLVVFDAVLLDIGLPDMSGFDVMTSLNESMGSSRPPIIIYTGRVRATILDSYADAGAVAVISKPFDPITLAQRLRQCVRNRHRDCDRWWAPAHPKGLASF